MFRLLWDLVTTAIPEIAFPNSFIKIDDFKSIEELGKYLKYLDGNDLAYNQYLQWSLEYVIELQQAMCNICKALWEKDVSTPQVINFRFFLE